MFPVRRSHPYSERFNPFDKDFLERLPALSPHFFRFLVYDRFLDHSEEDFSQILLTDVRDVIFQKDPFCIELGEQSYGFFSEGAQLKIASCKWNSGWILRQFGEEVLKRMAHNPISCSGTILGTSPAIQKYLKLFLKTMSDYRCFEIGGDQGLHNFLIGSSQIQDFHMFPSETGPVIAMGGTSPLAYRVESDGSIVDLSGSKFAVVHQYDRIPEARRVIERRYGTTLAKSVIRHFSNRLIYKSKQYLESLRIGYLRRRFTSCYRQAQECESGNLTRVLIVGRNTVSSSVIEFYCDQGFDSIVVLDLGVSNHSRKNLLHIKRVKLIEIPFEGRQNRMLLDDLIRTLQTNHWAVTTQENELFLYPNFQNVNVSTFCEYLLSRLSNEVRTTIFDVSSNKTTGDSQSFTFNNCVGDIRPIPMQNLILRWQGWVPSELDMEFVKLQSELTDLLYIQKDYSLWLKNRFDS